MKKILKVRSSDNVQNGPISSFLPLDMNKNVYAPPLEAFEIQFQEFNDPRALERNQPFRKNIYPWRK